MPVPAQQVSRRARQRVYAAAALLSLAVWLFIAVAESWTPLHAWLHGGSIPDNDDCAVALVSHGKVDSADGEVTVPVPVIWTEVGAQIVVADFCPTTGLLPCGRAPPVLTAAS